MRAGEAGLEDYKLKQLKERVDELCEKIIAGISKEDFFRKEKEVQMLCQRLFPEKLELYKLIYQNRFKRLWEQFRGENISFEEQNGKES